MNQTQEILNPTDAKRSAWNFAMSKKFYKKDFMSSHIKLWATLVNSHVNLIIQSQKEFVQVSRSV